MNRIETLEAAKRCINGDRDKRYGKPEDNFSEIAKRWECDTGTEFNALDVAIMMIDLKLARIKPGQDNTDTWVDICGYAACAAEIEEVILEKEKEKRRLYGYESAD